MPASSRVNVCVVSWTVLSWARFRSELWRNPVNTSQEAERPAL